MKAEEYIDKASTKTFHVKDRICSDNNIKAFAYMAADIARSEERAKAINAFCYVNCKRKNDGCLLENGCGGCKMFKELLNNEK